MFRLLLFILMLMPSLAFAQIIPPMPMPPPVPFPKQEKKKVVELPKAKQIWEIAPKEMARTTKHIMFLIDSSGSMNAVKIGTAIEFVLNKRTGVAAAPFDDFQIALATFGDKAARWEGTADINPDTNLPMSHYGWSAMPSLENLKKARKWINNNLDGQGTDVLTGLRHVFHSCSGTKNKAYLAGLKKSVNVDDLTILVITDGEFNQEYSQVAASIAALQKLRKKRKLGPAVIGYVGIDVNVPEPEEEDEDEAPPLEEEEEDDDEPSGGHAVLSELARKHGRLGYMRIELIDPDEEEDD